MQHRGLRCRRGPGEIESFFYDRSGLVEPAPARESEPARVEREGTDGLLSRPRLHLARLRRVAFRFVDVARPRLELGQVVEEERDRSLSAVGDELVARSKK